MNFLRDMFSEKSDISAMRAMSMISLVVGSFIAIDGLQRGSDLSELSVLCSVFIVAAFGGKIGQKIFESKDG